MSIKNFQNHFIRKKDIIYFCLEKNYSNVPDKIKVDGFFMRQFGKWYGDKTNKGGDVGLTGLNEESFNEWRKFLIKYLKQPIDSLKGEVNYGKNKQRESNELFNLLLKLGIKKERIYVYKIKRLDLKNAIGISIYVQNSKLRRKVFDFITKKEVLEYLFNNKELFYAFIGGLFDSDGNVNPRDNNIRISFSVRATKRDSYGSFIDRFEEVKNKTNWLSKLLTDNKINCIISPQEISKVKLKNIYNKKGFIGFDIKIGSRKPTRNKDFNQFWELVGKNNIKEKYNDLKRLIVDKNRTKNSYVLYVFFISITNKQFKTKEIAIMFRKEKSTIQRVLQHLSEQNILSRKRTMDGFIYKLGKNATKYLDENNSTLLKI